jgi:4-alpha-glucanotransferase
MVRERLERADLFYHAFRIDHVLGFFRIWAIPEKEVSGILGYFKPSRYIPLASSERRVSTMGASAG